MYIFLSPSSSSSAFAFNEWNVVFFFLVLSYSLFYSVPRLFHNAGMAGFCNPFWNIVDVLYSYIYRIYHILLLLYANLVQFIFLHLKFFFWLAANCRQMLHLTHCRGVIYSIYRVEEQLKFVYNWCWVGCEWQLTLTTDLDTRKLSPATASKWCCCLSDVDTFKEANTHTHLGTHIP